MAGRFTGPSQHVKDFMTIQARIQVAGTQAGRGGGGGGIGKVISGTASGGRGVTIIGLENLIRLRDWIGQIGTVIDRPDILLNIKGPVSDHLASNFDGEGHLVGGWQDITTATKKIRNDRGYGETPILKQSGGLRKMAVESFNNWHGERGTGRAAADPQAVNSSETLFSGSITSRKFHAAISGSKVQNQSSYTPNFFGWGRAKGASAGRVGKGVGYIPARPFWFINQPMLDESAHGVLRMSMLGWATLGEGLVARTGNYGVSTTRGARYRT
jgi:hypothetical protein